MKKLAIGLVSIAVVVGIVAAANGPQPSVGLYWYDNTDPTTGGGMSAPLNQLLVRTDSPSIYYKSGSTNTAWTKIGTASGGGGGGTVTEVDCGTGMSCAPSPITTVGTVNVSLTPTTCAGGMAEVATAANGTSTCNTFFNTAGTGISSSGSTVNVNLTTTTCAAGTAEITTAANGTSTCGAFFNTAGTGLANSGSTVSANLAGASCSAGQAVTAISSTGTGTCSAVGSVTSGSLTNNTIPKATGASSIANSLLTDDGTTFAVNSTEFTVTEASGNTTANGSFTSNGTTTLGDATHDTTTGRDLTIGRNLISTAGTTSVGQFTATIISPTAITGTVNDYNPTGLATAKVIILTLSAGTTLNGLAGGTAGREMCLYNSSGSNLTIANAAAGSSAANRFATVAAVSWIVASSEWACFVYDGVASLWRQVGSEHLAALSVAGTSNLGAVNSAAIVTSSGSAISGGGHYRTVSTALTTTNLSSCGAAPAIDSHSTDTAGLITLGAAAQTTCTLTFNATFTNVPFCQCTNAGSASTGALLFCAPTATTLLITTAASTSAAIVSYHCTGT